MSEFQHVRYRVALIAILVATGMFTLSVETALAQDTVAAGETITDAITATGDVTIEEGGTLNLSGGSVPAINSAATSTGSTISNAGTITTTGTGATGINSAAVDSVINSSGTISTTGTGATGITSTGTGTTISNDGSIRTTGDNATGILSTGTGTTISNDGSIRTTGTGITSTGDNTTISNDGSIRTTSANGHGILSSGTDSVINNASTISTTGTTAHGINATGIDAVINISGSVSATGEGSFAVKGDDDDNQTLNLSPGARIIGQIDLGDIAGDNDVINILGAAASRTYTFVGAEEINSDSPALTSRTGSTGSTGNIATVVTIDPTGSAAPRMALGATTAQIRRQVFQRPGATPLTSIDDGRLQADSSATNTTPLTSMEGIDGWATLFGTRSERDGDGLALAWDHSFYGAVGGFDARLDSGQRIGLFAGAGQGLVKTTDVTSIKDSTTHVFAGVSGQQAMGRLTLDGAVILGYARHDSTRSVIDNLRGDETASGKYNSAYISPSLALEWSRELDKGFELRPSAEIAYTYGHYGAYTESGTTNSNIKFDDRGVNIVDGRLQLALAQPFADAQGEIELRGGATFSHYGKDSVNARLSSGGSSISYRVPGDETIAGGYAGVNLSYKVADYVTMGGDIEYAKTSGGTQEVSGQVGLAVKF